MPSTTVARTECRRYLRGKTPWIIGIVFIFLTWDGISAQPTEEEMRVLGDAVTLLSAQSSVLAVVPFAAAALAFRSIIGERESGTARITLGTKLTRRRLVLETVLGRGTALLVPVVASTLLVVGYDAIQYGRFSLALLLGLVLLSTVYVFVWMGLLVGISAMSSSTTRAVAVGSVVTIAFFLWNDLTVPILWDLVTGTTPGTELAYPALFEAAKWVSPFSAYNVIASWLFGAPLGPEVPLSQVADAFNDTGEFAPEEPPLPAWSGAVLLLS